MKKLFGLLSLLVYIFSTNTLIHAEFMGAFSNHLNTNLCHEHNSKGSDPNTANLDCCELISSNYHSQNNIQFKQKNNYQKEFNKLFAESYIKDINKKFRYLFLSNFSPGRNPDIRYQKFSDLVGSIVNLA